MGVLNTIAVNQAKADTLKLHSRLTPNPSPRGEGLKKLVLPYSAAQVLSFGEDLGEATSELMVTGS